MSPAPTGAPARSTSPRTRGLGTGRAPAGRRPARLARRSAAERSRRARVVVGAPLAVPPRLKRCRAHLPPRPVALERARGRSPAAHGPPRPGVRGRRHRGLAGVARGRPARGPPPGAGAPSRRPAGSRLAPWPQADSAAALRASRVCGMPVRAASERAATSAGAPSPKRSSKRTRPSGRNAHDSVTSVPPSTGVNM